MSKSFSLVFLEPGHKVLVAHRRLYAGDKPRFFVGTVDVFNESNGLTKVTGYSFGLDKTGKAFLKKAEKRTRFISLSSGSLMVYELPPQADLESLQLLKDEKQNQYLTDGHLFRMDLTE